MVKCIHTKRGLDNSSNGMTHRFSSVRVCGWCGHTGLLSEHHITLKKMGGRHGAAKEEIEEMSNKIMLCIVCHNAAHNIRAIDISGYCCDDCLYNDECEHTQTKDVYEESIR